MTWTVPGSKPREDKDLLLIEITRGELKLIVGVLDKMAGEIPLPSELEHARQEMRGALERGPIQ
jgi:hypothetical protein